MLFSESSGEYLLRGCGGCRDRGERRVGQAEGPNAQAAHFAEIGRLAVHLKTDKAALSYSAFMS